MKILHVSSEYFGLAKTGGLADVCQALPQALTELGADARVCIPAYRGCVDRLREPRSILEFTLGSESFRVIEGWLPDGNHPIYLIDCPRLFDRPGDPYRDEAGSEYLDNGWRFGCFCAAVCHFIQTCTEWTPQLVHLHDWQTGLVAGWLSYRRSPVKTLFTIHNLAYQGIFGAELFTELGLPSAWWTPDGVEQFNAFSFMKCGINFSHAVSTVSPTYARAICTAENGFGLHSYLLAKPGRVTGILNGINTEVWNPRSDPYLDTRYTASTSRAGKRANKAAVLSQLDFPPLELPSGELPLLVFIGRFAEQKGVDLLYAARTALSELPLRIILLGSGEAGLEAQCRRWAEETPSQLRVVIGMDESMAHRLTAAADFQIMPSRFEPCGLSQMYAQTYGTLPIVHNTGGLADTVADAGNVDQAMPGATGIRFNDADVGGVLYGVRRALRLWQSGELETLRHNAMARNYSWSVPAREYLHLYRSL